MARRTLAIFLSSVVVALSLAEAYHYHPHGGARWDLVPFPSVPSIPDTDAPPAEGQGRPERQTPCPLHFWSSHLSTVSILLPFVLLPPAVETALGQQIPQGLSSRTGFSRSIRDPPIILS